METKLRPRPCHAGKSSDPVRASRLVGRMADTRLALYRRRRADPCQLALYAHRCDADEQEDRGCRLGSGGAGFTTKDLKLWGAAFGQGEARAPRPSRPSFCARF